MPRVRLDRHDRPSSRPTNHDIHIPPPPCEWFGGCEHKARCAAQQLACDAFFVYSRAPVANNRYRRQSGDRGNPTHALYLKTLKEI